MHLLIKMKPIKILVLLFFVMPLSIFAQGEDAVVTKVPVGQDSASIFKVNVDDLQKEISELRRKNDSLQAIITNHEAKIKSQEEQIKSQEKKLIFGDSIIARLSNDCFRKKYDRVAVENAINNFDHIYSPQLQKKWSKLRDLLKNYGAYTQELEDIRTEAENDKDLGNPFRGKDKALSYINKIKASRYYIEAYKKDWTIYYLNDLVDESINRLQEFDPKSKKITFTDKTEGDQLELMK